MNSFSDRTGELVEKPVQIQKVFFFVDRFLFSFDSLPGIVILDSKTEKIKNTEIVEKATVSIFSIIDSFIYQSPHQTFRALGKLLCKCYSNWIQWRNYFVYQGKQRASGFYLKLYTVSNRQ